MVFSGLYPVNNNDFEALREALAKLRLNDASFSYLPEYLATCRMHSKNKTLGYRRKVFEENCHLLKQHYGYVPFHWIYGYACYILDKRDQFYEPLRPSILGYFLSLSLGVYHNWRRIGRYLKEWFHVMTYGGLLRMWSRSTLARVLGRQRS